MQALNLTQCHCSWCAYVRLDSVFAWLSAAFTWLSAALLTAEQHVLRHIDMLAGLTMVLQKCHFVFVLFSICLSSFSLSLLNRFTFQLPLCYLNQYNLLSHMSAQSPYVGYDAVTLITSRKHYLYT